jgi:hypothetical protein
MPRQRQYDTPLAIQRRLKEGCGAGAGADYKPWIEVKDFSSLGRRHRFLSDKFGRLIHLLSDLERNALFVAEFLREVKALKDQYPLLPLSVTKGDAKALGIKHPAHPITKFPVVMSTDQIWTIENEDFSGEVAINVKYVKDREKPRNQEKRLIEEAYHARHGRILVDFDEYSATRDFVVNWSFVRPLLKPDYNTPSTQVLADTIDKDCRDWVSEAAPTQREVIARAIKLTGVSQPDIIPAVHTLIAKRVWPVDLSLGRLGPSFTYRFLAP